MPWFSVAKETKDHHGSDISGREKLIRQLMASLPNKDKPLQTSHGPLASDAALVFAIQLNCNPFLLFVSLKTHFFLIV